MWECTQTPHLLGYGGTGEERGGGEVGEGGKWVRGGPLKPSKNYPPKMKWAKCRAFSKPQFSAIQILCSQFSHCAVNAAHTDRSKFKDSSQLSKFELY